MKLNSGEAIQQTEESRNDPEPPSSAELLQWGKVLVFSPQRAQRFILPASGTRIYTK